MGLRRVPGQSPQGRGAHAWGSSHVLAGDVGELAKVEVTLVCSAADDMTAGVRVPSGGDARGVLWALFYPPKLTGCSAAWGYS